MTWIRTVPMDQADESLQKALEAQMGLYPQEYAQPVHGLEDRDAGIVASHSLIPDALYHAFATFGTQRVRNPVDAPDRFRRRP
jgi:hypothetical protein